MINQPLTKALVCITPGNFGYLETELPNVPENYMLLKIKKIGICGADLHAFEGTQTFLNYPRILIHELAAEIVQTQSDSGFEVGEAVNISPYFYSCKCIACRSGKPNCCAAINVCGGHVDGGMRQYLAVPTYSLIHDEGLSDNELALVEPLAIAAHGVRRTGVEKGEYVLVIGAGPIGLGTMEFA